MHRFHERHHLRAAVVPSIGSPIHAHPWLSASVTPRDFSGQRARGSPPESVFAPTTAPLRSDPACWHREQTPLWPLARGSAPRREPRESAARHAPVHPALQWGGCSQACGWRWREHSRAQGQNGPPVRRESAARRPVAHASRERSQRMIAIHQWLHLPMAGRPARCFGFSHRS